MRLLMFFTSIVFLLSIPTLKGQKYFTREADVHFFSEAPLENIEAHNSNGSSVLDAGSGRIEFAVLIKAFQFEKAKMQEDFNENFMESGKYPKAVFRGHIENWQDVDIANSGGTYELRVQGELMIHGQTNPLQTNATLTVREGGVHAEASFPVSIADYGIDVPSVVRRKIAEVVEVSLEADYQPME